MTTVQWKETSVKGNIAVSQPGGSYVGVIPFSVLNSMTLEQQGSQTLNCQSGAIVTSQATPIVLATSVPQIQPTPIPISLGTFIVPGNSSEGIKFTATQPGLYIFRYLRGSYSTYPSDRIPSGEATSLTAVRVFWNRQVTWDGVAIGASDFNVADATYSSNSSEAESKVQGQGLTISLLQGDYLILVAVDRRPYLLRQSRRGCP